MSGPGTGAGSPGAAAYRWQREPNAFDRWLGGHPARYRALGGIIVGAAVREGLLHHGDLPVVPGAAVQLARIAVASRDDLLRYQQRLAMAALEMAAVKAFFEHNFVLGLEAAFRHHAQPAARPLLAYRWIDAFDRRYLEALPRPVQMYAQLGMLALHSVFRDLHEAAMRDPDLGFAAGAAEREDALAIVFHWGSRVGAAMGLEKLAPQ